MIIIILFIEYKDIPSDCYTDDGKTLREVKDSSPNLRISSKCEIIQENCFKELFSLEYFAFGVNPNLAVIGKDSFYYCSYLKTIDLSLCSKLTKISERAFYFCYNVAEIILPKGLLEIQNSAFNNVGYITSIIIPASVEIIGEYAFNGCNKLENVNFEEGSNLTFLEDGLFIDTNIISFRIPEKVINISGYAFSDAKLTNLTIDDKNKYLKFENNTVLSADKSVLFFICNKSETYEIPDYVRTLGDYLFFGSNLKSITIPESVISIGDFCFSSTKLISIIIPKSVKKIGNAVFAACQNLTNVTFQGSLEIGIGIFFWGGNLELVIFPNISMIVDSEIFISDMTPNFKMSFTHKTLFSFNSIQQIANISVSYLNEPNLIINTNCFVTNFDQTEIYEFWGYNYSEITIPKTVEIIGVSAFENSTINEIYLEEGSQLSVIQDCAFRNCSQLNSFNSSLANLRMIGYSAFKDCKNLNSMSFGYLNLVIYNNSFENCINLENVTNMTDIPNECFSGCTKLSTIGIMEGATYIGVRSFENCISLENIIIPSSVEKISEYAFINCNNLKSITFSETNSLSNISINSISGCESLKNISNFVSNNHKYKCIDNTIYYQNDTKLDLIYHLSHSIDDVLVIKCDVICQYSFNHSNNIVNISLSSESVSHIESYSFNDCKNLKYINFPLSVEIVSTFAFHECKSIRCPLVIENKAIDYIRMIIESGIPPKLLISCRVVHGTNKLQVIKRIYNKTQGIFWRYLSK
ncbi:surface antigen BspA-like [Trichomonas vaginalis G3]|uniref:Surface antigen BspA-like n=1 Tax=Trichomonas vaginalis (strain ATCC PRA-98 / G3) TaxID=412133 RepID=A2DTX9_TRIV3|nr:antigen BSP-related family [Trichomonas vaginalis G3]EAY16126.1 surface antigen BspA-like [Trichomonas vaginalis G3]KAI5510457.1 antigen BSP-related family [Trichomonas vaginalis G3]|eukprot:XP_001328349.1 surface antigen BspA-like [Trichomonas vaginalis G3]